MTAAAFEPTVPAPSLPSDAPVKVCIVGVGAIGGVLGGRLARVSGVELSALARGSTLATLLAEGLRVRMDGRTLHADVRASAQTGTLGVQDVVVLAVKAHALAAVAPQLPPLIGPQTVVWTAMNGVPWWWSRAVPALGGARLLSTDPTGAIEASVPYERVLGGVVHMSCRTESPGVAVHVRGFRLIVGEPGGPAADTGARHGTSARVERLAGLLRRAGFEVEAVADVRQAIWYKLWGNLTMNPISALTGATVDQVLDDPLTRAFCSRAMAEAQQLGRAMGCDIDESIEDRHRVTRQLGAFKTSMLQDVEAGRPLELDAIIGAVHEIAQRLAVPVPDIEALLGLARLQARVRGLYPCEPAAGGA